MCEGGHNEGKDGVGGQTAEQRLARWVERARDQARRFARYQPVAPVHLDDLLDGPQRRLSAEEIEHETQRLLAVCAEQGVEAVVAEVATCRELLRSLAEACHRVGLTSAAQYLHYLENPYD